MIAELKYPFSTVKTNIPFALTLSSVKNIVLVDISALRPDPRDVISNELLNTTKGINVIVLFEKVIIKNDSRPIKTKIVKYIIFDKKVIVINSRAP